MSEEDVTVTFDESSPLNIVRTREQRLEQERIAANDRRLREHAERRRITEAKERADAHALTNAIIAEVPAAIKRQELAEFASGQIETVVTDHRIVTTGFLFWKKVTQIAETQPEVVFYIAKLRIGDHPVTCYLGVNGIFYAKHIEKHRRVESDTEAFDPARFRCAHPNDLQSVLDKIKAL